MNISASDNIVQISGLNSAEFLQGQITNDINLVSDNAMLDSAICSVKGRVLQSRGGGGGKPLRN